MEIKKINLSSTERFVCTEKDVRNAIENGDNIFVSFGYLRKKFEFKSSMKNRPKFEGIIVASFSVNRRLSIIDSISHLSFYSFKDADFTDAGREEFVRSIFPQMIEWYHQIKRNKKSLLPGLEELIIELINRKFVLHAFRIV